MVTHASSPSDSGKRLSPGPLSINKTKSNKVSHNLNFNSRKVSGELKIQKTEREGGLDRGREIRREGEKKGKKGMG